MTSQAYGEYEPQVPVSHNLVTPSPKCKFCSVCRQKLEESDAFGCKACDYNLHPECKKDILNDCKQSSIYRPGLSLSPSPQRHHWREGVSSASSKCYICKKVCGSSECLTGLKCSWCSTTVHAGCQQEMSQICNFGPLHNLIVPPYAVSTANTSLWMTRFQDNEPLRKSSGSLSLTSSQGSLTSSSSFDDRHEVCNNGNALTDDLYPSTRTSAEFFVQFLISRASKEWQVEKLSQGTSVNIQFSTKVDSESSNILRIFDGDIANPHGWRNVRVSKDATTPEILEESLKQFHITEEKEKYYLTKAISKSNERRLEDYEKPMNFIKDKKPQIFLRHNTLDLKHGKVTVYAGMIETSCPHVTIEVNLRTPVRHVIEKAIKEFKLGNADPDLYSVVEVQSRRTGVKERYVENDECLWEDLVGRRKHSIAEVKSTRYYLVLAPNASQETFVFIGNLPTNLLKLEYENMITCIIGKQIRHSLTKSDAQLKRQVTGWTVNEEVSIAQLFPLYGCLCLKFSTISSFISSYWKLKETSYDERVIFLKVLPDIKADMISQGSSPLLVFVNGKSGGGQGARLISRLQRILNPHQVFDVMEGGPLVGLSVFRNIQDFRILICGGDGTFGWILSSIDEVKFSLLRCKNPASALLPLGTGNDLARILKWGSGYTSSDDLSNIMFSVDNAVLTYLDSKLVNVPKKADTMLEANDANLSRAFTILSDGWNIAFDSLKEYPSSPSMNPSSDSIANSPEDDPINMLVMNNYFGIGVDAVLALEFHLAREEAPSKFNSRLRNKGVYFRAGLRNMGKSNSSHLQNKITIQVDGKTVDLPTIEGILVLNISSWAGGSDCWGRERDDRFKMPTHNDGLAEVVGVTGVVHMGRIKSGISSAIRLAQGASINITLKEELPVQIDGEPWVQPPCQVIIRPTLHQARMLMKNTIQRKNQSR